MARSRSVSTLFNRMCPSTKSFSSCRPRRSRRTRRSLSNQAKKVGSNLPALLLLPRNRLELEDQSANKIAAVQEIRHLGVVAESERVAIDPVGGASIGRQIADVAPQAEMPAQVVFHPATKAVAELGAVRIPAAVGIMGEAGAGR